MLEKSERCAMCGTADWEWKEDRFAYEPVERFCHGCYLKSAAQENDPHKNKDGITIELLPTRTVEAARRLVKAQKKYEAMRDQSGR